MMDFNNKNKLKLVYPRELQEKVCKLFLNDKTTMGNYIYMMDSGVYIGPELKRYYLEELAKLPEKILKSTSLEETKKMAEESNEILEVYHLCIEMYKTYVKNRTITEGDYYCR